MSTSRNIIHPEIQWYQPIDSGWHILDYDDIVGGIVQWKNILHEQVELTAGQKFGVGGSRCDYTYLTAIFAGIELGGKIIVMPTTESGQQLIGPIDGWLYEDHVEKAMRDGNAVKAKHTIPWSTFHNFKSRFDTFSHLNQIERSPEEKVLVATTSGSTGTPRIVEYSHRLFDDVRKRSIKIFKLESKDRVLHLSNMHHGGTGGVFFLPSLSACKHHYYFDGLSPASNINELIRLIKSQKITKAMFPNNLLVSRLLDKLDWLDHDFEIYVNQANTKPWINAVKRTNVKAVHSLFGSTETLGPIFLNSITRDSTQDHNVLNYGKLLDDHYQIDCRSNCTVVTIKNHYQEILSDCFAIDSNGDHIFQSRTTLIRINDCTVSLRDLNKLTHDLLGDNGVIVPDTVTNKIYVAYTDKLIDPDHTLHNVNLGLKSISPVLQIDHANCVDLDQFVSGIKLSIENLRAHFRQTYQLL